MLFPKGIKGWKKNWSANGEFRGIQYEAAQYKDDSVSAVMINVLPVYTVDGVLYNLILGVLQMNNISKVEVIEAISDFDGSKQDSAF